MIIDRRGTHTRYLYVMIFVSMVLDGKQYLSSALSGRQKSLMVSVGP